jgi:ppGpp synthetase/RelA/SpoT-type nucleotidyltranferase
MLEKFLKLVDAVINREDTTEESAYIKKILTDYRNKRHIYDDFRDVVHKLIDSLLREKNYKYQIVSRTKMPDRLREKLIRKNKQGIRYRNLDDVEDLVGVRVLFYSEADKERFIKDLKKEVDVIMHIEDRKQDGGYEATHVVVTFGEKRLQLSEYKHFFDLKGEIQITSILRHAWAEIEHDFIYKDIGGLKKRDPEKFTLMKQKLSEILEKHIKQASKEFEEIIKLVDR